jgi:hypothetical protein
MTRRHIGQTAGHSRRSGLRLSETSANDWKQIRDSQKKPLR